MRRWDEPIEVRRGIVGEGLTGVSSVVEGPSQFLWRNRLWRVLDVQSRWVESGPWWNSVGVRAARGDAVTDDDSLLATDDLLCEQEVWRVEAASGQMFSRGVYELANALSDGSWRLRVVID